LHLVHASLDASSPTATVVVRGDLDLVTAQELRDAVMRSPEAGCSHITIDLAQVSFMDCAGLSGLLWCRAWVTASGGRFTMGPVSAQSARLLKLTGFYAELVGSTAS
jgi:anti-anti-sigma factor